MAPGKGDKAGASSANQRKGLQAATRIYGDPKTGGQETGTTKGSSREGSRGPKQKKEGGKGFTPSTLRKRKLRFMSPAASSPASFKHSAVSKSGSALHTRPVVGKQDHSVSVKDG